MLSWTCLKNHPQSAAIWHVAAPTGALVLKQHRHPRPFQQELRAYHEWLPALALAGPSSASPLEGEKLSVGTSGSAAEPPLGTSGSARDLPLGAHSSTSELPLKTSSHTHLMSLGTSNSTSILSLETSSPSSGLSLGPSSPTSALPLETSSPANSPSPQLYVPEPVGQPRIRVPALLACDLSTRTLALSASPGERLSLGTHAPALVPAAHAAAGRFLRALHELPVADDDLMPLVDAVAARQSEWHARARDLLTPAERDALQRLAARRDAFAGVRRVPCHRDFTPDNWLLGADGLCVLDFEHARLDAPEADLVKLCADVWPDRPDLAEAFFAGHGPLTPDATARLDVLLALHAAATLAWAERHDDPAFRALGRRALAVALERAP
ncbi:aminoglycoside phosphotransferase family protein [Nannocystis pusilla]|uniref:aminoglycoside phosphotransferase family protein n=1 Tax=Nannocystis pusilla TaxID=889268 RepID=UPI003B81C8D5